jgi:small subunit ribosomal protein S6
MREQKKNLYEGMYLVNVATGDDIRNKVLEKIQAGITSRGGEIHKVHDQGRKRLAYEIKNQREGHYYLIYFSLTPSAVEELWQDYHLTEELLRFITLRTEEVKEKIEFKALPED